MHCEVDCTDVWNRTFHPAEESDDLVVFDHEDNNDEVSAHRQYRVANNGAGDYRHVLELRSASQ